MSLLLLSSPSLFPSENSESHIGKISICACLATIPTLGNGIG